MRYENQQPEEGLNVSKESPVKQLFVLGTSALVLLLILFLAVSFLGGWLARFVPFSYEVKVMEALSLDFDEVLNNDTDGDPAFAEREAALQDLASRVMQHMDIPENMEITVHYISADVFNAFATLGGHVFFFQGLIDVMPSENALAMVMAHEIAHEVHRDPISGLGGGVAATLVVSSLAGGSGSLSPLVDFPTLVGSASFTRGMETKADSAAIKAVNSMYGHVAGAEGLFTALSSKTEEESDDGAAVPEWAETFLRTHPLDHDRIQAIHSAAEENGWLLDGVITPLNAVFTDSSTTD